MAWSFGSAHAERRVSGLIVGGTYSETDWETAVGVNTDMRFWFRVVNGLPGDPLPPGDFDMEVDLGSGWQTWQSIKLMKPGRIEGLVEFFPDYAYFPFLGVTYQGVAGVYPIRLVVTWPGGPYYSNTITLTVTSNDWVENTSPAAGFVEEEAPTGGFAEVIAPTGGFAEVVAPTGGFVEATAPTGGFVEAAAPIGGFVEAAAPTGGFVENVKPSGGFTEVAAPTGGFVEDTAPTGGFVENTAPTGSWTEN